MSEDKLNIRYLKAKYKKPTWENMLEECKEWYREGFKQGKFDKEMEKEELIKISDLPKGMIIWKGNGVLGITGTTFPKKYYNYYCSPMIWCTKEVYYRENNITDFNLIEEFVKGDRNE